jgi:hypothetical protein
MVYAVTTASLFRNLSHSRLLAFQLFVWSVGNANS